MRATYRHGYRSPKKHHFWLFAVVTLTLVGATGYLVYKDVTTNQSTVVQGVARTVGQASESSEPTLTINEPLFSLHLPGDWKEYERINSPNEQSITWHATKKGQDNRLLKIYIDSIPVTLPINRLMPVTVDGDGLVAGDVSDNCATFTDGGTKEKPKATSPARWAGVDFICNIAGFVDNQVGVAAIGTLNQFSLAGQKGTHKYFLLFTDRNIQPNYSILQNTIESFQPK